MHTIVRKTPRRALGAAALSASLFALMPSSLAITAEDVMKKMSNDEKFYYLSGLIDMRAFQATQSGDGMFSKCIYDAYYRDKQSSAWIALFDSLEKFSDKQPAAIVFLLTQKLCGK